MTVAAADPDGEEASESFTVEVQDVNEARVLTPEPQAEQIVLGSGPVTIDAPSASLDGDVINGFSSQDTVKVLGASFGRDNVTFSSGSVIMDIDTDGDGSSDTNLTFTGFSDPGNFAFKPDGENTRIELQSDVPEVHRLTGTVVDASGDPVRSGTLSFADGSEVALSEEGSFARSLSEGASAQATEIGSAEVAMPTAADGGDILRMAMGLSDPDEFELIAADVDQDGAVTAADAQAVYKTASGLASDGQVGEYVLLDADADYSGARLGDTGYLGGVDIPALTDDLDVSLIALQLGQTDQFDFA